MESGKAVMENVEITVEFIVVRPPDRLLSDTEYREILLAQIESGQGSVLMGQPKILGTRDAFPKEQP